MEEKHTITNVTKILMVSVAALFDLVQFAISFIPILGEVISIFIGIFAQFTFYVWFKMNGVSYKGTKRVAAFATGTIIGFIPILDMLPELTLEVVMILGTLELEKQAEKLPGGEKLVSAAEGGNKNLKRAA